MTIASLCGVRFSSSWVFNSLFLKCLLSLFLRFLSPAWRCTLQSKWLLLYFPHLTIPKPLFCSCITFQYWISQGTFSRYCGIIKPLLHCCCCSFHSWFYCLLHYSYLAFTVAVTVDMAVVAIIATISAAFPSIYCFGFCLSTFFCCCCTGCSWYMDPEISTTFLYSFAP